MLFPVVLLVLSTLDLESGGLADAELVPAPKAVRDAVIRLPQYGSVRYAAPPGFKSSARILFWTPAYGAVEHWSWWFNRDLLKDTCPELRCDFLFDRKRLNDSDAVLFMTYGKSMDLGGGGGGDGDVRAQLPPHRRPHQRWVHVSLEPPRLRRDAEDLRPLNGLFNWTMDYRWDADVYAPFGRVVLNKLPARKMAASMRRDYSANKTKMAAWLVSHCHTDGRREDYVSRLQRHLAVDIYGRCGPLKCEPAQSEACYEKLNGQYRFYLAFENVMCEDYVTEKFVRALSLDMVPVVFGGADYASYAPRGSYINALDFPSPAALAARLEFLAESPVEYNRYFDWKRGYSVRVVQAAHYVCELCMKLLDPEEPEKHYEDLDEWWHGPSRCEGWNPNDN